MRFRVEEYCLAGGLLLLALVAGFRLLVGGYSTTSIIEAAALLTPHLLVAMLAASRYWMGIALGGLGLCFSLPLPLLHRIEFGMILTAGLLVLVTIRASLVSSKHSLFSSIEDRLMAVLSIVILLRIAYERPGSANVGESGGLAEAFYFGLGVVSYFMMIRLTTLGQWRASQIIRVIMVMLVAGVIVQVVMQGLQSGWVAAVRGLFERQLWFLSAMAMSWALSRAKRMAGAPSPQFLPYFVAASMLALSVITPFRSRPVFAVAITMAVAYIHGRLRSIGVMLCGGVVLFVVLWGVAGSDWMPFVVTRSLSTIMPMTDTMAREYAQRYKASSEVGWGSGFRAEMNRMAWESIKENPLVGRGFKFTRDELVMQSLQSGSRGEMMGQLAVSGMYHDAVVELAVFCGVPLALLFVIAYVVSVVKNFRVAPRIRDPWDKVLMASLLGFLMAETGQLLMNGSGRDFYYICVLLGAMRGMRLMFAEVGDRNVSA